MLGSADSTNVQGEEQTKLDVFANRLFVQCLRNRNIVCGLVSEEDEEVIHLGDKQACQNRNEEGTLSDFIGGAYQTKLIFVGACIFFYTMF